MPCGIPCPSYISYTCMWIFEIFVELAQTVDFITDCILIDKLRKQLDDDNVWSECKTDATNVYSCDKDNKNYYHVYVAVILAFVSSFFPMVAILVGKLHHITGATMINPKEKLDMDWEENNV